MSDKKFKYEITEAKEDSNFSVITKRNVDVEFTMAELMEHEGRVKKMITEASTKVEMEKAAMENVAHHHADAVGLVDRLAPEKQHAIFLYLRALATVVELEPKVKEMEDALAAHQEEVKDIKEQTGWIAPDISVLEKKEKPAPKEKVKDNEPSNSEKPKDEKSSEEGKGG